MLLVLSRFGGVNHTVVNLAVLEFAGIILPFVLFLAHQELPAAVMIVMGGEYSWRPESMLLLPEHRHVLKLPTKLLFDLGGVGLLEQRLRSLVGIVEGYLFNGVLLHKPFDDGPEEPH